MFTPKVLALGALTAGLIGVGLFSSRNMEIWMPKEEIFYRKVCTQLIEKNFPEFKTEEVHSYQNNATGYTVNINVEEGPDLRTGWKSVPEKVWAAECGFDGQGRLMMFGIYNFKKDIHIMWSDVAGWINLKDIWEGETKEKPRSLPGLQEV